MADIIIFPEDDDWEEVPNDFLDGEDSESTIDILHDIRKAVGASLRPLITDFTHIQEKGQASTLRGIRFTSGADALIWLFRRGIFLFSNVVQMGDGTWAVSIRDSDGAIRDGGAGGEDENADLLF